jgi:hypothetical protein
MILYQTVKHSISKIVPTDSWALLMVLACIVVSVLFSIINPIHEATDELRHYRYIRTITDNGQLPVQSGDAGNSQAHHPPLYYASAALVSWWVHPVDSFSDPLGNPHFAYRNWEVGTDNKNLYLHGPDEAWPYQDNTLAAHLARWVTVLWGAAAVWLTIAIARVFIPERPAVAIAAASLIAFNPMFAYLSGAINNDVPAALVGAAITLMSLLVIRDGITTKRVVVLGVLYGLANLVKFNLIAMLSVIVLALVLSMLNNGDRRIQWRELLRANGIILGITALVAGWWYARNTILYGEPTGFLKLTEIWGVRDPSAGVNLAGRELAYAWTSLWARFGYGQIPVPTIFYSITAVLTVAGIIGLVVFLARSRRMSANDDSPFSRKQWAMLWVLLLVVTVNFAVLYAYILVSPAGAMGRFFFPGLSAFVVLIAAGLLTLLPAMGQRVVAGGLTAGMLAYVMATLFGYLVPAYALPAQASAPDDPLDIRFGDVARIIDYSVSPESIRPGEAVDVTVTWEVLHPTDQPHQVFIHLISQQGAMVAQRDTYTGLGNYPSQWWVPGHIFTETYRVYVPDTAISPDDVVVRIGLSNPDEGVITVLDKGKPKDRIKLADITIDADPEAEYPSQTYVNWDDRFALVGYSIEPRALLPGGEFVVTLYWKALNPPQEDDYKVFLHVMEGWELQWAANDGNPVWANESTRSWVVGEVYRDERSVRLSKDIPPGNYTIELGWFADASGKRLNIIADDGHIIDNWLSLNSIRVLDPD